MMIQNSRTKSNKIIKVRAKKMAKQRKRRRRETRKRRRLKMVINKLKVSSKNNKIRHKSLKKIKQYLKLRKRRKWMIWSF